MNDTDKVREEFNRGVWDASSDELKKLQIDLYNRGESDGSGIPNHIKRTAKRGKLFGMFVGLIILLGLGYLLVKVGGSLSVFVRSLF